MNYTLTSEKSNSSCPQVKTHRDWSVGFGPMRIAR